MVGDVGQRGDGGEGEPEAHQAHLAAVGVPGEDEVGGPVGQVGEGAGVVEQRESQRARRPREAGGDGGEVLAAPARTTKSYPMTSTGPRGRLHARHLVDEQAHAHLSKRLRDRVWNLVVVVAHAREGACLRGP